MSKVCPSCGSTERVKKGNGDRCAQCNREAARKWRTENKEKHAEYQRQWYSLNKDEINQRAKENYPEIAEKDRERSKQWAKNNPEKKAIQDELYRKRHPKRIIKSVREWQKNNPDKVKEIHRRRRARKKNAVGDVADSEWQKLCEYYNNTCLCCNEVKELTQDHIKPLSKNGTHTIDNLQPLCRSCNAKKGNKFIDYRPSMPDWILSNNSHTRRG